LLGHVATLPGVGVPGQRTDHDILFDPPIGVSCGAFGPSEEGPVCAVKYCWGCC
jgi:hypothetical protein